MFQNMIIVKEKSISPKYVDMLQELAPAEVKAKYFFEFSMKLAKSLTRFVLITSDTEEILCEKREALKMLEEMKLEAKMIVEDIKSKQGICTKEKKDNNEM